MNTETPLANASYHVVQKAIAGKGSFSGQKAARVLHVVGYKGSLPKLGYSKPVARYMAPDDWVAPKRVLHVLHEGGAYRFMEVQG